MKFIQFKAFQVLILFSVLLLTHACQDPMYDLNKGIDTEISVGGDSLAIPLGFEDSIFLRDFLDPEDIDFLEIMEDGGYGFSLSDSLFIDDVLSSIDKSKLKFDDYLFSEKTTINFGGINLDEYKINGFNRQTTLSLSMPDVKLDDITPSVNMNQEFKVGFTDYALSEEMMTIDDFTQNTTKDNFLAEHIPVSTPNHPEVGFEITEPLSITESPGNPLKVSVNYSIEVPEGIKNIHEIELQNGAELNISIELRGASTTLKEGTFTPSLSIDPSNLFKFGPFPALQNGKIVFDASNPLTNFNGYKSEQTYTVTSLHNLPSAINNFISITKEVLIDGSLTARGTLLANKGLEAKEIDLVINVVLRKMKIKNMDFDIPTFTTAINGNSVLNINETGLPSQINRINTIYLEKEAFSPLSKNMVIQFMPSNLPEMTSSDIKMDLTITFPQGFVFNGMAGRTYAVSNAVFDKTTGFKAELDLSSIDLSSSPIVNGALSWSGTIEYSGTMRVNGRMDSEKINPAIESKVNLTTQTALKLKSAMVQTNTIKEPVGPDNIAIDIDINVSEDVARLSTINIKRGGMIRIRINRPELPLTLSADNLAIQFSNLFEFYPRTGLVGNKLTLNGAIPDVIELELKALNVNKDLVNGRLVLNESISISGGIQLDAGTVSSTAIEDLKTKQITTLIEVNDLYFSSTAVELNTLEAEYKDSTALNLEINDIPAEIVSLDSIILKSGSNLMMDIALSNLPNLGNNPLLAKILVKFPELLVFGNGAVNTSNELLIEGTFVNGRLSRTVPLRGLKFDGKALNGKIKIDQDIAYEVTVTIENPTVNTDEITNNPVNVDVNVNLKGLEFQKVYGKFNLNLDEDLEVDAISLDLPEMLKGEDVVLDISNPVLTLSSRSNIGIPLDAELGLLKYIGGQPKPDDKISFAFRLPATASATQYANTNYWVAPSLEGKPANYTFVQANLQNILKPLPDSIKIEIKPTIDQSVQHSIDLSANYSLKLNYALNVPFKFGKDFSVTLKDTLDDIDLGLDESGIKAGQLELFGSIINSIPLNLELQLLLTDVNFNILATSSAITIKAGGPNGSGVASTLSLKLDKKLDELSKLNKVILTFKATSNSTVAGTPILPENFIKADLKARIIGGVKVKL